MDKRLSEVCNVPVSKICKKCHKEKLLTEFWVRQNTKDNRFGSCMECERSLASYRFHNNGNKEKQKIVWKKWKQENPDKVKNQWLKLYYNITLQEYNELFENQNGCCAICGVHQSSLKKSLSVDHDHASGIVRGLLCSKCNTGLGQFNDNKEILKLALLYLENGN